MTATWLQRVLTRRPKQKPLVVDTPIAIIGDLHGRADLLKRMLDRLEQEAPEARKIFVGDYIDRGPDSAGVLRQVMELPDAVCLMGNHERMMLEFLEDPEGQGARWLRHGGTETLASFGIHNGQPAELRDAFIDAILDALGPETLDWLKSRPLFFRSGTLYVTHASADPMQAIEEQTEATLLWGHRDFGRKLRRDGYWGAHGHTIVPTPVVHRGCISLDTGAFATDRLSAAVLNGSDLRFLEVTST